MLRMRLLLATAICVSFAGIAFGQTPEQVKARSDSLAKVADTTAAENSSNASKAKAPPDKTAALGVRTQCVSAGATVEELQDGDDLLTAGDLQYAGAVALQIAGLAKKALGVAKAIAGEMEWGAANYAAAVQHFEASLPPLDDAISKFETADEDFCSASGDYVDAQLYFEDLLQTLGEE